MRSQHPLKTVSRLRNMFSLLPLLFLASFPLMSVAQVGDLTAIEVTTPEEFQQAIVDAVPHIVIKAHLNMVGSNTTSNTTTQTAGVGVIRRNQKGVITESIRVRGSEHLPHAASKFTTEMPLTMQSEFLFDTSAS
jgi:hypothetical protein